MQESKQVKTSSFVNILNLEVPERMQMERSTDSEKRFDAKVADL
jgi:hypothetical protein